MNKFSWVLIESFFAAVGFGYGILNFLTNQSPLNTAFGFAFGIFMSLIVLGMASKRSH